MRLVGWLALQGLRSSRSFILLVLAVALAAGFQMSNAATLAGFDRDLLDDALVHGQGDVRISPRERRRFDPAELAEVQALDPAFEVVPLLVYAGGVAGSDRHYNPATIYGVDASARHPPFRLLEGQPLAEQPLPAGAARQPAAPDVIDVLLGTSLARRLDVRVGDRVELRAIVGPRDELLDLPNTVAVHAVVRGVVSGTRGGYRAAFVDRAVLGRLMGAPGATSLIAVHLEDHAAAGATAARIAARLPDVEARAWPEDDPGLTSFLASRRAIGTISYGIVIAAIAIPMWSLLYIHVLRKRRELAILTALGLRRRELFAIATAQSAIIAVAGCILGAAFGYALTRYFVAYPVFSWESLTVRPLLEARTLAVPLAVITLTAIVAALHPAARAARVDPAAALRRIE